MKIQSVLYWTFAPPLVFRKRNDGSIYSTDPVNAGQSDEFQIGLFRPDHGGNHTPSATPPVPQTPLAK
jgi:hypothetical protein